MQGSNLPTGAWAGGGECGPEADIEVAALALPLPTVFFSPLQAHIKCQISDLHKILYSNHYRSYSFKTFLLAFSVRQRQQTA